MGVWNSSALRRSRDRAIAWLRRRAATPGDLPPIWTDGLAGAEARGELSVVYQPKFNLRSNRIEDAEALIRWSNPDWGAISPADFIPVAEQGRQIDGLTRWVLDRVLADQRALHAAGLTLGLSINLSGSLVADAAFTAWALGRARDAVAPITMEVTETAVIDDPAAALANLHAYVGAGVRIAIDDYGAGLSSLAYLKEMPASELKIDRLFIHGLTSSHRDPLLVRSTIDLAHALDMRVTAEGVETGMALSLLRVMGCDCVQGFHIARPMARDALADFVAAFDGPPEGLPRLTLPRTA